MSGQSKSFNSYKKAILYLSWDDPHNARFRTYADFLAWGNELGMDFTGCEAAFEMVKTLQIQNALEG